MTLIAGRGGIILVSCWLITALLTSASVAAPQVGAPPPGSQVLVVGVTDDPPYLLKGKDGNWTGINVDIWKAVASELRVDYVFKEMTFDELLNAMKAGSVDMSIEAFFVTADRAKWMYYSFPFGNTRLALATLPEKAAHPWWSAIKIFFAWGTIKVIGVFFLILCALGFLFWLIERKDNADHFGGGFIKGVGAGMYWVGSTLTSGVCLGISLKSVSARVLGLMWMLVCAVALSALIASLTTALTESRAMVDMVSEHTLRQMQLAGIKGSAETATIRQLGGRHTFYPAEGEALKALMRREVDGFLYDEITLNYYKLNDYKGKIVVSPTGLRRFSYGFGFPWGSPWRGKVDAALLNLMEKPDWAFLLNRYGLGENFEEKPMVILKKRK